MSRQRLHSSLVCLSKVTSPWVILSTSLMNLPRHGKRTWSWQWMKETIQISIQHTLLWACLHSLELNEYVRVGVKNQPARLWLAHQLSVDGLARLQWENLQPHHFLVCLERWWRCFLLRTNPEIPSFFAFRDWWRHLLETWICDWSIALCVAESGYMESSLSLQGSAVCLWRVTTQKMNRQTSAMNREPLRDGKTTRTESVTASAVCVTVQIVGGLKIATGD